MVRLRVQGHGRRGGLGSVRWEDIYVTSLVHSVGVRRNKITEVLTVRLREWVGTW